MLKEAANTPNKVNPDRYQLFAERHFQLRRQLQWMVAEKQRLTEMHNKAAKLANEYKRRNL